MSRNLRNLLLLILLLVSFMTLIGSLQPIYAQPGGGGNPCPGGPPCNPNVPISGIEILLAAGGVLGIKRFLKLTGKSKKL